MDTNAHRRPSFVMSYGESWHPDIPYIQKPKRCGKAYLMSRPYVAFGSQVIIMVLAILDPVALRPRFSPSLPFDLFMFYTINF